MKTFAKRLQMAIEKLGISQAEAARRCGVSQQSINYIISNDLKHSKLAVGIAASLNINPDWLIYGEGKFKETTCYEIPVLGSVYELLKYLNNDIDKDTIRTIMVDTYLGDLAFAYLVEANKMAICCKKEYDIEPMDYLCISGVSAEINQTPMSDLSFSIIEWRTRRANFNLS
jgi:transcriptional regulator with XRE-family HTH domain